MVVVEKPKITPQAIAYYVMVAVIVASIIYTKHDTANQVSASEIRQNDRNTRSVACLAMTFEDFLTGNQKLRDANAAWQKALVKSKRANRRLVILEEVRGLPRTDDRVQAAALDYVDATGDFIRADKDLGEARRTYKLPDFEARCGDIASQLKGSWYDDIQRFNGTREYPTGLSVETQ